MNGEQHHYEINLKQGDLYINLTSDDVYFISKQMEKWFAVIADDSYAPIAIPPSHTPAAQAAPAPASEPAPQVQPAPPEPPPQSVQQQPAPPPPSQPEPQAEAPPQPPPSQPRQEPQPAEPAFARTTPEPPPAPEPVAEQMPAPEPEPPAAPPQPINLPGEPAAQAEQPKDLSEEVKDDFEAVMDSLMKDLEPDEGESAAAPERHEPQPHYEPIPAAVAARPRPPENPEGDIYQPEPAISSAQGEGTDMGVIESLSDLCDQSRAETAEDYLLLAAYYLTYFEGLEKFSLKQINSLLVKSGLTPVNHSVLETSLSQDYLAMVPDLTGMADVSEYSLTEHGQQYSNGLL